MAKSSRKVMLAVLTILLCVVLLIGGTYALFSASSTITNHLIAGNLTATLVRESYSYDTLDENGRIVTNGKDPDGTNFSDATSENLFGIDQDAPIAPGCKFTANMSLTNQGSVAFKYWIEVRLKGDSNKLAEQLMVTVTCGETKTEQHLSERLDVGTEDAPIGEVNVGQKVLFSVCVEFTDNTDNNDAQNQRVDFDFVVHALQVA